MLLPQSSAFAALKNRLNSVNAIALLHTPPSMPTSARPSYVSPSYLPNSISPTSSIPGPGILSSSTYTPLTNTNHTRQRSIEKAISLPLSLNTIGISPLTTFGNSVAAGSNIPGSSTSTVARLARRDAGGSTNSGGEVRWNELLDKFKSTQERARRRNERAMRGEEDDSSDNELARTSSISRTQDGTGDQAGGRTSRASGRQSLETGRPGSGLSIDRGSTGLGLRQQGGNSGISTSQGITRGLGQRQERIPEGQQVAGGGDQRSGQGSGQGQSQGHRSKHSLIGKFGIRSGSKDKERDGGRDGKFGGGVGGGMKR